MYTCARDLEFRLNNTLVWYKGEHVFVRGVRFGGKDDQQLVLRGDEVVSLADPELRVNRIPTGYVNHRGKIRFLKRKANRTYRQGLRVDNCVLKGGAPWAFEEYINDRSRGKTFDLNDGDKILSKDFALLQGELHYRGTCVGVVVDGNYHLDNESFYLKELLDEVLGKILEGVQDEP